MAGLESDRLIIPYGCATVAGPAAAASHHVIIVPARRRPLRLYDGDWRFAEPPNPARLAGSGAALGVLREHLKRLCDPWAASQGRFVDGYFAVLAARVAQAAPALRARLARFGDLYRIEDFGFSALAPLPRAHLADADGWIAVDSAFWTGAALVAIDIADTRRPRRRRAADHARLAAAGAEIVALAPEALGDPGALARSLPAALVDFLDGETLPASPFKAVALGAIVDAGATPEHD